MSVVMQMEMPQGCVDCPFRDILLCCCAKGQKYTGSSPVRPDWCPIICQLPEGHGRLVDKDEMLKKIENYHRYMTVGRESDPRCIIEDSPTIVPAERRET